jgi:DNA-binding NarL/FixJ family response regulator
VGFVMSPSKPEPLIRRILLRTLTPVLARGFTLLAAQRGDLEVAVCDGELPEFLNRVKQWQPAVVLIDTMSHVDFAVITELQRHWPEIPIVLWIDLISIEVAYHARSSGVRGVLRKNASDDIVIRCLLKVAAGEQWFERSLLVSLLAVREVQLSPRQRQLLRLVAQGLSNKQLAYELTIGEGTVKVYLAKLFRKIGVHDRYELAMYGLRSLGYTGMQPIHAMSMELASTVVLGASQPPFGNPEPVRTREQ